MDSTSAFDAGVTCSAPGKVLLAGGYIVLQAGAPPGLVVCTSSRFYSSVFAGEEGSGSASGPVSAPATDGAVEVVVESPQFRASWRYALAPRPPFALAPRDAARRNPDAEHAIELALCAASGTGGGGAGVAASLAALAAQGRALRVVLRADNDFYSQRRQLEARALPLSLASLAALPRFLECPVGEDGAVVVNKTGLGSSAALVASLVGAVMAFVGATPELLAGTAPGASPAGPRAAAERLLVHSAAQVAHGLAQGKVGSGFDICSAAFGSIRFSRIAPEALGARMEAAQVAIRGAGGAKAYAALARDLVTISGERVEPPVTALASASAGAPTWAFGAAPFYLPDGISLMLADVAGGSETPSMVRQILAWRDAGASAGAGATPSVLPAGSDDAGGEEGADGAELVAAAEAARAAASGPPLWRNLAAANARIAVAVGQMKTLSDAVGPAAYRAALDACAGSAIDQWRAGSAALAPDSARVARKLALLADAFALSRRLLREMGEAAGVPVEPPAQTSLADDTLREAGVVAAGVPGAGGFDALFAVIVDVGGVRGAVEARWLGRGGGGLTPLPLHEGDRGLEVRCGSDP